MKALRIRSAVVILRLATVGLLGLATTACSETYLAHRDTLSPGSGNAIASDISKQVIDPWPAAAFQEQVTTSGARLQQAMERYNNPSSGPAAAVPNAAPLPVK